MMGSLSNIGVKKRRDFLRGKYTKSFSFFDLKIYIPQSPKLIVF